MCSAFQSWSQVLRAVLAARGSCVSCANFASLPRVCVCVASSAAAKAPLLRRARRSLPRDSRGVRHGCSFDPWAGQGLAGCQTLRRSFSAVWTATIPREKTHFVGIFKMYKLCMPLHRSQLKFEVFRTISFREFFP